MDDMIEVYDESGKRLQIPRSEFVRQMKMVARQNWDSLDLLRQLTVQFLQGGFAQEALEMAERACEVSNEHVNDLYWRAAALAEVGRLDEAEKAFGDLQDDAAYAADQARAVVGLAQVKARKGQNDEAAALLEQAAETDPTNPGPMLAMVGFWSQLGRGDAAMAKITQLAEQNPQNVAPYRALAQIAASAGDKDHLSSLVEQILQRTSDEHRQEALGEVTWLLGQAKMPEQIIARVEPLKDSLQHPWALMNLAQAYLDTERKEDARQLLTRLSQELPPPVRFEAEAKLKELEGEA